MSKVWEKKAEWVFGEKKTLFNYLLSQPYSWIEDKLKIFHYISYLVKQEFVPQIEACILYIN